MKLAARRTQLRFTRSALARRVGTTPSNLCKIESGVSLPRVDLAIAIAKALATTVEELF